MPITVYVVQIVSFFLNYFLFSLLDPLAVLDNGLVSVFCSCGQLIPAKQIVQLIVTCAYITALFLN